MKVVEGKPVKAVVQLTKQAFAYAFDRANGEPLWPIEERARAQRPTCRARWTSPTQPFPTKPPAYDRQGFINDDLDRLHAADAKPQPLEAVKDLRMGPMFTTGSSLIDAADGTRGTLVLPHFGGGSNWEGGAADPETGMLYVGSQTTSQRVRALNAAGDRFSDMPYVRERRRAAYRC